MTMSEQNKTFVALCDDILNTIPELRAPHIQYDICDNMELVWQKDKREVFTVIIKKDGTVHWVWKQWRMPHENDYILDEGVMIFTAKELPLRAFEILRGFVH